MEMHNAQTLNTPNVQREEGTAEAYNKVDLLMGRMLCAMSVWPRYVTSANNAVCRPLTRQSSSAIKPTQTVITQREQYEIELVNSSESR